MSKDGFLYSSKKIDVSKKITIVASKWNAELVNELLQAGKAHLEELGFTNIKIVSVPGAWELVHAAHFQDFAAQACIQLALWQLGDIDSPFTGPRNVGQYPEQAVEIGAVRLHQSVR